MAQPSAIAIQPSSHQPSAISHQPSAISHQPSAISHQPSAVSHQPSAMTGSLPLARAALSARAGDRAHARHLQLREIAVADLLAIAILHSAVRVVIVEIGSLLDRPAHTNLFSDELLEIVAIAVEPIGVLGLAHLLLP